MKTMLDFKKDPHGPGYLTSLGGIVSRYRQVSETEFVAEFNNTIVKFELDSEKEAINWLSSKYWEVFDSIKDSFRNANPNVKVLF